MSSVTISRAEAFDALAARLSGRGPAGEPQIFSERGDVVVATIEEVGSLTHRVE